MRIGELAEAAGTDVETIRYYEKEGLLPEPARTHSGYRHYLPGHLETLRFIRHCRSLDMPLADIRRLSELSHQSAMTCDEINALVDTHLTRVSAHIAALQQLQAQLQDLRHACAGSNEGPDCGIIRSLMSAAQGQACACHHDHAAPALAPHGAVIRSIKEKL